MVTQGDQVQRSIRILAALTLWLATVGPTAYGVISQPRGPASPDAVILAAAFLLLFLTFPSVGLLIAIRRPGNVIGWVLLLMGLNFVAGSVAHNYASTSIASGVRSPVVLLVAWFYEQTFSIIAVGLTIVFLTFPTGRLSSGRVRLPGLLCMSSSLVGWVLVAVRPGPLGNFIDFSNIDNPLGAPGVVGELVRGMGAVPGGALLGALVLSVGLLVIRFRTARGDERQQLKWLALAGGVGLVPVIGFVLSNVPGVAEGGLLYSIGEISYLGLFVALPLGPLAIGLAILRYRLYAVDRIISNAIGYGLVSLVLFGVFAAVNLTLVSNVSPLVNDSEIAVAASTLLVAALFNPVRVRVQRVVDRRFHRARYDAEQTVAGFASRLRDEVDLPTLARELDATVRQAIAPSSVDLWLRGSVARHGVPVLRD